MKLIVFPVLSTRTACSMPRRATTTAWQNSHIKDLHFRRESLRNNSFRNNTKPDTYLGGVAVGSGTESEALEDSGVRGSQLGVENSKQAALGGKLRHHHAL